MSREFTESLRVFVNEMESYIQIAVKEYGLEHLAGPQGRTIVYLYHNRDKEIFVKDIEAELKIAKSVASNLVKRMERNGFIVSVPSQKDKRYKHIELTVLGLEQAPRIESLFESVRDKFFRGITKEEMEITVSVLKRIERNLKERK